MPNLFRFPAGKIILIVAGYNGYNSSGCKATDALFVEILRILAG